MKKTTLIYLPILLGSMLLIFGSYTIVSWAVKMYTILQEENMSMSVSIISDNNSSRYISRTLTSQWLEGFTKLKYVCNIDNYIIHDIVVTEEDDKHFIFFVDYSVLTKDKDTCWKNARQHTERNGLITIRDKFRVNKVGNKYYLRTLDW